MKQSMTSENYDKSLNILSWNVYMLPKPIKFSLQALRSQMIAEQLKNTNYDFIILQEAFTSDFRDLVIQELSHQYPYNYHLDRDNNFYHFFCSGLLLLSRYPMKIFDCIYFDNSKGADKFAAKGAVLFEAQLPNGCVVQVGATHLQASRQHGPIRLMQLSQIKNLLQKYQTQNVAQILVGDLNIDFSEIDFSRGLDLLKMKHAPMLSEIKTTCARVNDCYNTPKEKMWIDHALIDLQTQTRKFEMNVIDFSFSYNNMICPSSDHHAVEIKIEF